MRIPILAAAALLVSVGPALAQPVAPVCAPFNTPDTRAAVQAMIMRDIAAQASLINGRYYAIVDITPPPVSAPDFNGQVHAAQTRPLPQITGGIMTFGLTDSNGQTYMFLTLDSYARDVCQGHAKLLVYGFTLYDANGQRVDSLGGIFTWYWDFSLQGEQISLDATDANGTPLQQRNGPAKLIQDVYTIPKENIQARPATAAEVGGLAAPDNRLPRCTGPYRRYHPDCTYQ